MKRNMDLIREIMMRLEKSEDPTAWVMPSIEGFSGSEISYHIMLLHQAEFIDAIDTSSNDEFEWFAKSITWKGHEFLDSARDQKVWSKAKESLGKRFTNVSFSVLQSILSQLVKNELGLGAK